MSTACAQINAGALPSAEERLKCAYMGASKIADVNVVSHRCAVRGVIICAENLDLLIDPGQRQ
jgi:hypothetical protein